MKYNNFFYILLCTCSLMTCADKSINDLDIDVPDQEQRLVINLELIEGDTEVKTFVARTSNINEPESTFFDDAIVELYKNDDFLAELIYDIPSNDYIANLENTLLTEGNYRVEVSGIEGLPDISAIQTIPQEVTITEGSYEEQGTVASEYGYAYPVDEAVINFKDPTDEENYYFIKLYVVSQDTFGEVQNRRDLYLTSINPIAETLFYNKGLVLKDDSFNGKDFELSIGFSNYYGGSSGGGEVFLDAELINITRDHYLYLKSLDAFRNAEGNPFAEPVIVHNNINNGIGIFRAGNASNFKIEFE